MLSRVMFILSLAALICLQVRQFYLTSVSDKGFHFQLCDFLKFTYLTLSIWKRLSKIKYVVNLIPVGRTPENDS